MKSTKKLFICLMAIGLITLQPQPIKAIPPALAAILGGLWTLGKGAFYATQIAGTALSTLAILKQGAGIIQGMTNSQQQEEPMPTQEELEKILQDQTQQDQAPETQQVQQNNRKLQPHFVPKTDISSSPIPHQQQKPYVQISQQDQSKKSRGLPKILRQHKPSYSPLNSSHAISLPGAQAHNQAGNMRGGSSGYNPSNNYLNMFGTPTQPASTPPDMPVTRIQNIHELQCGIQDDITTTPHIPSIKLEPSILC